MYKIDKVLTLALIKSFSRLPLFRLEPYCSGFLQVDVAEKLTAWLKVRFLKEKVSLLELTLFMCAMVYHHKPRVPFLLYIVAQH